MRGVIDIVIGLVLIVGGLSGRMALIGTHSGGALALLGAVVLTIGLVRILKSKRGS
jgi:hypothetical protein